MSCLVDQAGARATRGVSLCPTRRCLSPCARAHPRPSEMEARATPASFIVYRLDAIAPCLRLVSRLMSKPKKKKGKKKRSYVESADYVHFSQHPPHIITSVVYFTVQVHMRVHKQKYACYYYEFHTCFVIFPSRKKILSIRDRRTDLIEGRTTPERRGASASDSARGRGDLP